MTFRTYGFESLEAWKRSREFRVLIKKLSDRFPRSELFGLTSQIRRSSGSVSYNLVEGSAKQSGKDQARFTNMAAASLMECLDQLIEAYDLGYLNEEEYALLRKKIDKIMYLINGLYRSQCRSTTNLSDRIDPLV